MPTQKRIRLKRRPVRGPLIESSVKFTLRFITTSCCGSVACSYGRKRLSGRKGTRNSHQASKRIIYTPEPTTDRHQGQEQASGIIMHCLWFNGLKEREKEKEERKKGMSHQG